MLRGDVAGVHEALFSLVEGDMHLDENGVFAEVALSDLHVGADGGFELVIGPDDRRRQPPPGRRPAARLLLIREYLYDWATEPIPSFSIERPDAAGEPAPPVTGADVAAALDRATRWVERSIDYWAAYVAASRDLLEHNTFTPPNTPPGGAPSIAYGGGCWDLGPDEALVIEHDVPDAHYWNWTIHQLHWFDSGAWDQRLMSCNGHQAHVDADGRVRLVVAAHRPRRAQLARHRGPADGHGRLPLRRRADEAGPDGHAWCRWTRCRTPAPRRPPGRRRGGSTAAAGRPLPRRAASLELR